MNPNGVMWSRDWTLKEFIHDFHETLTLAFFVDHECSVIETGHFVFCCRLLLHQSLHRFWYSSISQNIQVSKISRNFAVFELDLHQVFSMRSRGSRLEPSSFFQIEETFLTVWSELLFKVNLNLIFFTFFQFSLSKIFLIVFTKYFQFSIFKGNRLDDVIGFLP